MSENKKKVKKQGFPIEMGFVFGQKSDFQNITKGVKGDFSTFDVDRPRNALKGICGGRFVFSVICCYIVMSD